MFLLTKIKSNIAYQILLALILGVLFGLYLHHVNATPTHWLHDSYKGLIVNILKPMGDIFIKLIKMIVIPIVLSTLIVGIANMESAKKLGTLGGKTILYFEVVTTLAIVIGIVMANVFQPGTGIDTSTLHMSDTKALTSFQATSSELADKPHGLVVMILDMIPSNIVASMAQAEMLPVIFFSVLFGVSLLHLPKETKEPLLNVFKGISDTMFRLTSTIMHYAPIGVFGLISVTIAQFGFAALLPLAKLVIIVYAAMALFILVVLGLIARLSGLSLFKLLYIIKDELLLAFSTASSEAVLPKIMQKMEAYGVPKSITGFVIPTGYSFNLDGSTLYQSIAVIFIAQLNGIDLSLIEEISMVITLMLASKGIAGVPGVSFVVLTTVLTAMGLPVESLAFILGVDRILDMGRTVVNVVGNSLASLIIAKWENKYDEKKADLYYAEVKNS
ncbi:glutamate/aspartate:proton symporter GltP [Snodgrassella sp. CFCC 13594]|uniref:glutamate/aspartate:proton symporter GltP n=1 Tax=Snodgrassella sp. CFCC 13594 TaxID=1775559 RepID=UPI00083003CB|nr:glutamate/aspartate:proton symporter GltP [Snodgrassella sp. CFCC 13594]